MAKSFRELRERLLRAGVAPWHVRRYLAEPVKANRDQILLDLESQEGATPDLLARLLAHMRPPLPAPDPDKERPGFFELEVEAVAGEPPVAYSVQLPPEYDPYRRYPTVLTLRGAATTPERQIEWWAGPWSATGLRLGQASRHGYIVVAPAWAKRLNALSGRCTAATRSPISMLRAYRAVFMGAMGESLRGVTDLRKNLRVPIALLVAMTIWFGFFPQSFVRLVTPTFKSYFAASKQ